MCIRDSGWTEIQSGDVTGWVSDEYLAFGEEAAERASEVVPKVATVVAVSYTHLSQKIAENS